MRNFVCMLCGLALAGLLIGSLNACSSPADIPAVPKETDTLPETASDTPLETAPDTPSSPEAQPQTEPDPANTPYGNPVSLNKDALSAAFAEAIEEYCRTGRFPDGAEPGSIPSRISYAVYDVDGDGQDELILQNVNDIMAAMTERVYSFNPAGNTFQEEFSEFPALTYYDNGIIQADWSHNQGKAGDFWPYTLYQYQAESDSYEMVGAVDAWDRRLTEETRPETFPADVDADGDGMVYYLIGDNWNWNTRTVNGTSFETWEVDPVDGPAYEDWRGSFLQNALPVSIPYKTVDVETVFPNAAG